MERTGNPRRNVESFEPEGKASPCIYPFGSDPVVKLELKRLRRELWNNREGRWEQRLLRARLDATRAESKELKKQFAFKRKPVGME